MNALLLSIGMIQAGILTDSFRKLFNVIWDVITWIGNFIKSLLQDFVDIIIGFFEVIYALIDGLLYLLYKIGMLAVKLFLVILEIGKFLWSLIVGLGKTLASLTYTPQLSSNTGYSEMLGKLFANLDVLQIDVIAYILLFSIWLFTAISGIKLISSIRVGGD